LIPDLPGGARSFAVILSRTAFLKRRKKLGIAGTRLLCAEEDPWLLPPRHWPATRRMGDPDAGRHSCWSESPDEPNARLTDATRAVT
jgi:hypothetical protein